VASTHTYYTHNKNNTYNCYLVQKFKLVLEAKHVLEFIQCVSLPKLHLFLWHFSAWSISWIIYLYKTMWLYTHTQ